MAAALMAFTSPLLAQNDLPRIDLATLTASNWQQSGGIASVDKATIKSKSGTGVLISGNSPLTLTSQPGDFMLQFDWLTTAGGTVMLTLPNGYAIDLTKNHAAKAAGLWQTAALTYQAGAQKKPASLVKYVLNGITINEGQTLPMPSGTGQAVQLMAKNGSVAIRNVGVRALANRNVASWAGPLTYKLYKEAIETREGLASKTPIKTDTVSRLSYDVAYGQSGNFTLTFDGKLNVPTTGDYQFDMHMGGFGGLWIDGKQLVAMDRRYLGTPETSTIPLTAGTHDVQVMFSRSWPRPGLGLYVSQAGTRPQALQADGSLPEFAPVGQVLIEPDAKPTLIRSFIHMPGEITKRTHALSVGSRTGMHYSVDLDQMALLMAWKGDFADATELWYERGEPQLLKPNGTTIYPAPRTALAVLPNATAAWPDSVGDNVLQYKGISLDKDGSPSIDYSMNGTTIRDQIRPTDTALSRTLTLGGAAPTGQLYCRLAAGKSLEEVSKGLYAVDDRSYFVRFDSKASVSVRQSGGKQELIMPVSMNGGKATVQYSIEF
ncbi:hypothetical protein J2I47_11180 [Fibrella sp. HMF5335]|uniref:PA14 domain-containing protein n=1 Tax=Fibrella rubiginis TaxID=2817060 RepID=A0A939GH50_9BACT|nr:hypothetical protein [Fibrella rubiginis]